MPELSFFVEVPKIVGKARPRFNGKTGRVYTPKATADAERLISREAFEAFANEGLDTIPKGVPVRLDVRALFRCPKAWTRAKHRALEAGDFFPCLKTPDGDNVLKLVCDALNGVAFEDDKQVYKASVLKKYTPREKPEGLLISIFWK